MFHNNHLNHEEKSASLMQLDSLVPYQYLETTMRKVPLEAEKKLMLAVIEDAIYCFQKYCNARSRKERRLFADTEAWIVEAGGDWIFSFEHICESMGLDPSCIRRGLMQWKQAMLGRAHPESVPPGGGRTRSHKKRLRMAA
jgi:hypothetical protein